MVIWTQDGGIGHIACTEVEEQVKAWMRTGQRMLPDEVWADQHMTEVWFNTIEKLSKDVSFVRTLPA